MAVQGRDTESRYPPPVCCGLASRSDWLFLSFLLQCERPLEHQEGGALGLAAPALRTGSASGVAVGLPLRRRLKPALAPALAGTGARQG